MTKRMEKINGEMWEVTYMGGVEIMRSKKTTI